MIPIEKLDQNILYGLPRNGLQMAFLPSENTITDDNVRRLYDIADPQGRRHVMQTDNSLKPVETFVPKKNKLGFFGTNAKMVMYDIPGSMLMSGGGAETTFMMMARPWFLQSNFSFCWFEGTPGNYDAAKRYSFHFPWGSGNFLFDLGNFAGSRITVPAPNDIYYQLETITCVLKSPNAQIYRRDALIYTTNSFVPSLNEADIGSFAILNSPDPAVNVPFQGSWYGLLIWNRALSDSELTQALLWQQAYYYSLYAQYGFGTTTTAFNNSYITEYRTFYTVDASGGNYQLLLVPFPLDGQYHEICKINATNSVTINGNGRLILGNGGATPIKTLTTNGQSLKIIFNKAGNIWQQVGGL